MKKRALLLLLFCCLAWRLSDSACLSVCGADEAAGDEKMDRLYTVPDPGSQGGIRGKVAVPDRPIEKVLAIPADDPSKVYQGEVPDSDSSSFLFSGLPMDRYDLVVIYEDAFYEGLRLHRGESTLTEADLKDIKDVIQRSEPFFTHKIIHRLEGATGKGQSARAICTFYREKIAETYMFVAREGYRRTFKLIMLRDVGPGWQIERARDLHPIWTTPEKQQATHVYCEGLSNIRVTDSVRDLGVLMLGN